MDSGAVIEPTYPVSRSPRAEPAVRILAVGNMYPPQHAGGYELMWQQAMEHARSLGHAVRVLTSDYVAHPAHPEQDPDVHRTLRWYWDLERYEFPRLGVWQRVRRERHNAAELHRHLEEFRPDVVTWWSMGCMSLSLIELVRRAGVPAVFVVHDDWLVYGPEHDQWLRTWTGPKRSRLARAVEPLCGTATRIDLSRSGQWVFNSRYTLERARETGLEAPAAKVIHPGIDGRFLASLDARPWEWRLVYVGRLDRQKGVDTAVAALAELPPQTTLTIWGTGDRGYVAEMEALAARIGARERVRFNGFVDGADIRSAYREADAVLFPVRWNEPFGLVPLEAMGLGRPVVTTARGGTAEYVRDGQNALVFAADDSRALADCVRRLGDDQQLRARLRSEGRRTAARFPSARFAQDTVAAIVSAAAEAR